MIDEQGNDLGTDQVFKVAEGVFVIWICAPKRMTKEQVQEAVDSQIDGPGTRANRWEVQEEASDTPQLRSPGHCAEDDTRQHWKAHC